MSICSLQTYDKASTARLPNYLIETQSFFHSFFRGKNGAWPRTPYGPSRGSEGGRREIFESYSSCTLPAVPPLVADATTFPPIQGALWVLGRGDNPGNMVLLSLASPLKRGHYGCWAFESICVYGDNGGKPYNRASPVENRQTALTRAGNAPLFPLRGTSPGGGSFLDAQHLNS